MQLEPEEIEAIVTAVTQGLYHPSMKEKMAALEAERAAAEVLMTALPQAAEIPLHPGLAAVYAQKVADLSASLNQEGSRHEAVTLLRGLIERVILQPDATASNGHVIELYGELGAILSLCSDGRTGKQKARSVATGFRQISVVAGARFGLTRTIIGPPV